MNLQNLEAFDATAGTGPLFRFGDPARLRSDSDLTGTGLPQQRGTFGGHFLAAAGGAGRGGGGAGRAI
jgi:hypothetical protein